MLTAVYTINHVPSLTTHNKSPFELFYGQTDDYSSLQVFGCACFVSLPLVEQYKACLITKCFTQEYGIDYEETFALVARLTFVKCLIVVAAIWRWPIS